MLGGLHLLVWAAVLLRPYDVFYAFSKISEINDKVAGLVLALVWGCGMWFVYSLFRYRFPDLETSPEGGEVMSSFSVQENTTRKIRVWLFSVAGGVVNLLALVIVELLLIGR